VATISVLTIALASLTLPTPAAAVDYTGTVGFTGQATFAAPIPGILVTDLTVSAADETEATGNGEQCEITATTSDNPDGLGTYPDAGSVNADMTISRGGPNIPDGTCIVKVTATATDGVSVSARGSQTVFVTADNINTSATVNVDDIVVRESKAIAGIIKECQIWAKKQLKLRDKCNALLLKKGPTYADKCKDAGPEPVGCDPGNFVEAILELAHADNNQQVDAMNAESIIDQDLLRYVASAREAVPDASNTTLVATATALLDRLIDMHLQRPLKSRAFLGQLRAQAAFDAAANKE